MTLARRSFLMGTLLALLPVNASARPRPRIQGFRSGFSGGFRS